MSDEAFARRLLLRPGRADGARRPPPPSATSSPARSSTRSAPRTTSSTNSTSTTTSSRRCRPRSTCWRARSPTPSRSGSRCRTSPSAGPASTTRRPRRPRASRCATPTTRPRWPDASRSSSPRSRSSARSSSATGRRAATPSASARSIRMHSGATAAPGTSSAMTSTTTPSTFRVSRIRSDIRFATRRERDFRLPPDFDVDAYRVGEEWQHGPTAGTARIEVNGDTAWWVHRTLREAGTLTDGVFETEYAAIEPLAGWVLRQNGRAVPLEPDELRTACAEGLRRIKDAHEAEPPKLARLKTVLSTADGTERPRRPLRQSASACCRRCSPTCSPPAATRGGRARRGRARAPLPHPAGRAAGSPLAAQPRQLRRRLLHGLRRARRRPRPRRQGALRRRLPARPG